MNALMSFVVSLIVYIGSGSVVIYIAAGQWWELYALAAWAAFWMAGLRAIALTTREIIIRLVEEIRIATAAYLEAAKAADDD
jgi:hypothetical protein